jgi:DNA-binding IscR family transcriptional regulator
MIPKLFMLRNRFEVSEGKDALNLTEVLAALSDGDWHKFDDLATETSINKETVLRIVNFFRDYGFIEISMGGEAAKLDKDYLKL